MAVNDVNNQTVRVYRGEDVSLDFTAREDTDVTDWDFAFTLKTNSGTTVLTLTSDDGDITVTDEDEGEFSVEITRAQTSALTLRNYRWDCWRVNSGAYRRLAGGPFTVLTPEYPAA